MTLDDSVSLSLSQVDSPSSLQLGFESPKDSTRYLKCPAGVTVRHLIRLLALKRGWTELDSLRRIELLYSIGPELRVMDPSWSLMHLANTFNWDRVSTQD